MYDERFKSNRADFLVNMPNKVTGTKKQCKTLLLKEVGLILSMDIHAYKFVCLWRTIIFFGCRRVNSTIIVTTTMTIVISD
jgi:hypothetical protein